MSGQPVTAPATPILTVVKGNPSDEEVAALLAVVLSRTGPPAQHRPAPGWADRNTGVRRLPRAGAGAWRTSTWR